MPPAAIHSQLFDVDGVHGRLMPGGVRHTSSVVQFRIGPHAIVPSAREMMPSMRPPRLQRCYARGREYCTHEGWLTEPAGWR